MEPFARAQRGPLLTTWAELDDRLTQDFAIHVSGSSVAFADYAQLAADFPELRYRVACLDTATVNSWLLERASLISVTQARGSEVNPLVTAAGPVVQVFRPPAYGRAIVTVVGSNEKGGLLDIKGAGVPLGVRPQLASHSNGMCSLSYLFLDLTTQWILDRVFAKCLPNVYSLPVYAIIDLGFDMQFSTEKPPIPAGLMIRRAHRRPRGGVQLPATRTRRERRVLEIELALRAYGISSCSLDNALWIEPNERGARFRLPSHSGTLEENLLLQELNRLIAPDSLPVTYEVPNIQMTREEPDGSVQVIDFEHYNIRSHFDLPMVSLAYDKLLGVGGVLRPGDAFPQPNSNLVVDPMAFRIPGKLTPSDQFGTELAENFRAGNLSARELTQRLVEFVDQSIPW